MKAVHTTARPRRLRVPMTLVVATALLVACQMISPARVPYTAAPAMPEPHAVTVRIVGGAELAALTRKALDRLFRTRVGARVRERIESGALGGPLTIELNLRGEAFTPYRVPGGELASRIVFDAWTLPLVETELGRMRATRETVLAHELGHAVLKLRDEERVIREVENPIREELGLPRRVRF